MKAEHIDPSEYVLIDMARKLAELDPRINYIQNESIIEGLNEIRFSDEKCIVLSGSSDYSIVEQKSRHPNKDLQKLLWRLDLRDIEKETNQYCGIKVVNTFDPRYCCATDKYGVKIDSYTIGTFNDIPDNVVKWFTSNLDVEHDRIEPIPFGMSNHPHGLGMFPNYVGRQKEYGLYINFATNTMERDLLKRYFSHLPWVTFRDGDIPVDQYLDEMSQHKCVLSPFGNGLDCYRTYEAMYLGCIPIIPDSTFAQHLMKMGLPLMSVDNYYGLTADMLQGAWEDFNRDDINFNIEPLKVSYWRDKVVKALEEL